jgi:anti-sigma B factor antagonist
MEITFTSGRQTDQVVATVTGDLDMYAAVTFARAVEKRMDEGARRVVVDFAEVKYLDSSGVGALIRLLQKARALGGELRVASLGGTPRKVLEMSNILSILKTSTDVEAALQVWS